MIRYGNTTPESARGDTLSRPNADSFRLLVESVKDYAIFMLDPEGRVHTWNAGAERIKGYTAEQIIGEHFSRFYPADAQQSGWPQRELDIAKREGRFEDEGWRVRQDGSRFWANVVITALRDPEGKLVGFAKVTRELTERRQREEALRLAEERFRLLVERVEDYAIFMLNASGYVESWNVGAERSHGYQAAEIIGRHFATFYTDDDVEQGVPWKDLALTRTRGRLEREGQRLRKTGDTFYANVVLTTMVTERGMLRGFSVITRDLTQTKRVEALEESDRRMREFLAILSHELRNPLAPIRHAVSILQRLPIDDAMMQTVRNVLDNQVSHLARVVDDLLEVSRIASGTIAIHREVVNLAGVIRSAVETVRPLVEERQHALHVAPFDAALQVRGDPVRLAQILTNLLNNAAKYTDPRGDIRLAVRRVDDQIELTVSDNGSGMTPQAIAHAFQFFTRGDRSLERSGGGLGVGLGLVKRLVELHGGRVEARSGGLGQGAEFCVWLPVGSPVTPEHGEAGDTAAAATGAAKAMGEIPCRRVLVVDDNADSAVSLSMLLAVMGHDTRVAKDGMEALEVAAEYRPQIAILDIGLPKLDGYEVAQRLRRTPHGARCLLVALTGWGQQTDRQRARDAGFDFHLVKPADPETLGDVLRAPLRTDAAP
jgi:PAS domain S-box-containing protein